MKVEKSVTVGVTPERAFEAFTVEIDQWWPLDKGYSFLGDNRKQIMIEGKAGGRFYELGTDGSEHTIGEVRAYEPPNRVVLTWNQKDWDSETEIEVRFTPDGDSTRVDLEHRGFESVGAKGKESHDGYKDGWVEVLEHYTKYAS